MNDNVPIGYSARLVTRKIAAMPLLAPLFAALLHTAAGFDLPAQFIHGAPGEPTLQVHEAAPGTWILRQGKASNFEAPFLYLVAGEREALLLDTGAEPQPGTGDVPVRATVDRLLADWARQRNLPAPSLIVAHTHGHGDHHAGDAQFADRPQTRVVGTKADDVKAFFALASWPEGEARVDLGGRTLTVLPLPGHEPAHIAVYDAATQTLLSGDSLYPGILTVRDRPAYCASVQRLAAFAKRHPVARVLGAHVEMTRRPREAYELGAAFQPEEHALALERRHVDELSAACATLGDFLRDDVHDDFIVRRMLPKSTDRPSTHGMLMLGRDKVYLSHLPMFHSPHDYQLILEAGLDPAELKAYRDDARAHPDSLYTIAPTEEWVLPDVIDTGATFKADIYRGHFERGGERIRAGATMTVRRIVHFRRFDPAQSTASAAWIRFGEGDEHYAAHRIEKAPDFDEVVELAGDGARLESAQAVKAGKKLGDVKVSRVIYLERGDLAE